MSYNFNSNLLVCHEQTDGDKTPFAGANFIEASLEGSSLTSGCMDLPRGCEHRDVLSAKPQGSNVKIWESLQQERRFLDTFYRS